jgi:hypothetical protein
MADTRLRNLSQELIAQIEALRNTLSIAIDDPTYDDVKRVLLATLFKDDAITEDAPETGITANNYQIVTPKAFLDSKMDFTNYGVGIKADATSINSKFGDGLLSTGLQSTMQTQWVKDWFASNGGVPVYQRSNDDVASSLAIAYPVVWEGALTASNIRTLQPPLSGRTFRSVYCQLNILADGVTHATTQFITSGGGDITISLGSTGVSLIMEAGGASFGIVSSTAKSDVKISMNVQAIMQ